MNNGPMQRIKRFYEAVLAEHVRNNRQMAFVTGPRQVGKTTVCRQGADVYLDWDNQDDRAVILKGPAAVAQQAGLDLIAERPKIVAMDELHKYSRWKQFLKGFFDTYESRARLIVTGSSRLDVYRRGGDSLMGRYFLFRMHPFSVAELIRTNIMEKPIHRPTLIPDGHWRALWAYGGYPEPFIRRETRFLRRWQNLRRTQLLREDVRDLTRIHELDQLAMLADLLAKRSGSQVVYSSLAANVRVGENTIRAWMATLCSLHYGFFVRPWFRNVSKALRKEPKWFLRDWSGIDDEGQRAETFCACHLLKAVEGWTDLGLGTFELRYIRDKQRREADFLVVRDGAPWFLVETKLRDSQLSPALEYFQKQIGCRHAFQLVMEMDYVNRDPFTFDRPIVVPARTLLSQFI